MPTVRNTGTTDKFVGGVLIAPNTSQETIEYPDPADTYLVVESDLPIWKLDMLAKPVKDAITTSKDYTVPYGTNTIEIFNNSSGVINAFNAVIDADNFEMVIPPKSIRYIDKAKNRVRKLILQGTAAINEVYVSCSSK